MSAIGKQSHSVGYIYVSDGGLADSLEGSFEVETLVTGADTYVASADASYRW